MTRFTRQHFQLIAEMLRTTKPAASMDRQSKDQWEWTVQCFAAQLATTNPNFKRDRFLEVCGL